MKTADLIKPRHLVILAYAFFRGALFLLLFFFFSLSMGLFSAPLQQSLYAGTLSSLPTDTAPHNRKSYKTAKNYLHTLLRSPVRGKNRQNWLAGVRHFRRLYLLEPNGALAPSCLYMIAGMYRQMFQRFHLPIDLDESIDYYQKLASLFPADKLADDALLAAAELYESVKKKPEQAAILYDKISTQYPNGDKWATARKRLKKLRARNQSIPDAIRSRQPGAHLSHILPIKHWSSADYTRIVIQASSPVPYTTSLLEKDGDQPRRLYINLNRSSVSLHDQTPIPIEDGLLKRIRTGQFNDNTVRVVLDIESISDYKIFSLKDPFRIVIDVHGIKNKKKTVAQKQTAASTVGSPKTTPEVRETAPIPAFITLEDAKKRRPRRGVRKKPVNKIKRSAGSSLSLAQQLGLGIRKIIIDPGHGGKDPGAMAFGLKEKDIVLKVAKKVKRILRKKYKYEARLTRNTDVFLPLEERTALANTTGADLFVSIHVNAHPSKTVRGIETFYLNLATNAEAMRVAARENATSTHNISEMQSILTDLMQNSKILESSRLAKFVQMNMISGLKKSNYQVKDHGVKKAPFYVLIGAQMPAVLAEISFITNPTDAKRLHKDSFLDEIARQIAAGITAYANQHLTAATQY